MATPDDPTAPPEPPFDEQPLEMILARNLVSIISLAAFLVDVDGHIAFYNEAAAEVIGSSFEETGSLTREQWNPELGPFDEHGRPVPYEELPLTIAVREGRPAYGRFRIRGDDGSLIEIEAGAFPLLGPEGYHGAMVVFWALSSDGEG
jgi:PAS domain-containing protein